MSETLQEFRRGWRVVLASSVGNGSGLSGIPFYTFSVFVVPLAAAFGWTRGEVSTASTFLILGTTVTSLFVGFFIDRFGARRVGIVSMLALCVGYVLLTRLTSLMGFYVGWGLMSLVGGGTTPLIWTRAINLSFDRGRGLALGTALAGSGLAGVFAPFLTTRVIATYGWRGGYLALAGFILLVSIPLLWMFFREPAPRRFARTATPLDITDRIAIPRPGLDLRESLQTVAFWKIAVGFFFVSSIISGLVIHLVPLLIDRGLSPAEAASVAGVMGLAVVVGRIGIGFLVDRFHAPSVAAIFIVMPAGGCILLSLVHVHVALMILSVVTIGFAAAAEVDLVAYLTSRFLGMKAYGRVYGVQLSLFYLGAAVGPFSAGRAYDHFHDYKPTLAFAAGSLLLGALIIGTLGRPPRFERSLTDSASMAERA